MYIFKACATHRSRDSVRAGAKRSRYLPLKGNVFHNLSHVAWDIDPVEVQLLNVRPNRAGACGCDYPHRLEMRDTVPLTEIRVT